MGKYDQDLEEKLKEIRECQESKNIKTCTKCNDEYLSCILRINYVSSVYQSMSKDGTGNFNF